MLFLGLLCAASCFAGAAPHQAAGAQSQESPPREETPAARLYDAVVYGCSQEAVAEAVKAARSGKSAALYVPGTSLGGAFAALKKGASERGSKAKSLSPEIPERTGAESGFAEGASEDVLLAVLSEADVPVYFGHSLKYVKKDESGNVTEILFENGSSAMGKSFLDASGGNAFNAVPALAAPGTPNPGLKYYYPVPKPEFPQAREHDVVVYGGTPGGVAAAIQAKRMGKSAALYVFRRHVGGLTSSGLTESDFGGDNKIGGIAVEFYEKLGKYTGFRPSDAENTFLEMLSEAGVPVYFECRLEKVSKDGAGRIAEIAFENGDSAKGKMFVDATYEGDLYAMAGCSYMVGREDNARFRETLNGVHFSESSHQYRHQFDPYVVPGYALSGLIEGLSRCDFFERGRGDKKLQSYCFRMWATKVNEKTPWPKPDNYRPERFEILKRYVNAAPAGFVWDLQYGSGPVKINEGDCNNAGPVSIDHVGGNYGWAEGSYEEREKIFQDHVDYQKGFMWFLANDESIPEELRKRVSEYGLDAKEFPETGNWPHELYVREARRLLSDYVMTQANCQGRVVAEDSVGLASYTMDSHHVERVIRGGKIINEGGFEVGVPSSYPVSYRSIVPKKAECSNLFVPVALSASHVAFGSIRMEPVFMVLGQSAATAASMAIDENVAVQDVDYPKLREKLLADGQKL